MKHVRLHGKRWWQARTGNTYHSVEIWVDDVCVHKIPYAYGYDDQWQHNGMLWLDANGYLPGREKREGTPGEALWRYCERKKIGYIRDVVDVTRKKDL
jgi:hypothetical protein